MSVQIVVLIIYIYCHGFPYSGLNLAPVSRLRGTWEKLPSKYEKLFGDLQDLFDPSRNMAKYRNVLSNQNLQPPIIPLFPVIKKDLTFLHEGKTKWNNRLYKIIMASLNFCRQYFCKVLVWQIYSNIFTFFYIWVAQIFHSVNITILDTTQHTQLQILHSFSERSQCCQILLMVSSSKSIQKLPICTQNHRV